MLKPDLLVLGPLTGLVHLRLPVVACVRVLIVAEAAHLQSRRFRSERRPRELLLCQGDKSAVATV